jgi:hypothetical protein
MGKDSPFGRMVEERPTTPVTVVGLPRVAGHFYAVGGHFYAWRPAA